MRILLLFIASLIFFSCSEQEQTGTTSDIDIELAGIAGFDSSAVSNARVTLFKVEEDNGEYDTSVITSMLTEVDGRYVFDSVKTGSYYITAYHIFPNTLDTVQGLLANIAIAEDAVDTVMDTLWMHRPGAIKGSINLSGGTGLATISVSGTSSSANIYGSGDFKIYPVWPDSNLTLVYTCDGFSTTMITGVSVFPGDTLEVAPQNLVANAVPQNVKAVYDTANNVVTLSWNPMLRDDLDGYVVVRKENPLSTADPQPLNALVITDTFYVDTLKDELFSQVADSTILTFRYHVLGDTPNGKTGYSKAVDIDAYIVRDSADVKEFLSLSPDTLGLVLDGLSTTEITWKYRGLIENVLLELTTDGGAIWTSISGPISKIKNDGFYIWPRVRNVQSDQCQLRISSVNGDVEPMVSKFFTINMLAGEELIVNGDFSTGDKLWVTRDGSEYPEIEATTGIEDGMFKATIIQGAESDSETWKVRLAQSIQTQLYKGYTYQLRFKAKASVPVNIMSSFSSYSNSDSRYFWDEYPSLDTMWQEFEYTDTLADWDTTLADEPIPEEVALNFFLAIKPADIWIDDVSLRVIGVK